jgi:hypothetical protein
MTSLLDRQSVPASAANADAKTNGRGGYRIPVAARGRRPLMTVGSALLVLVSIAVFSTVYSSADHRVPVLTVTSTIQQGQRITSHDLGTAEVASSGGLSPVPVASASELSGKWAAVTIPAGSLLTLGDVTSNRPLAGGSAVVGLALKDGQLPSIGVEPGDQVMIVQTLGAGSVLPVTDVSGGSDTQSSTAISGTTATGVLVAQASVFETATPTTSTASGAAELVSVVVPSTLAAAVATAAAASQVSVVLLPAGSNPSDAASGSS